MSNPDQSGESAQPTAADQTEAQHLMLPLPRHNGIAAWVILVINIGIFVIPRLLDLAGITILGAPVSEVVLALGEKNNQAIWAGGQYYRLISAILLHYNLLHIAFNSYALYQLGPEIEQIYGTWRFLVLYVLSGIAGNLAAYLISPHRAVGASGAIFGLVGAMAAFYYVNRAIMGEVSQQMIGNLATLIVINLFIGFSSPSISNEAHIGGLVIGALLGWALAPRYTLDQRHYPPTVVGLSWPLAWVTTIGILVVFIGLIVGIRPPL